MAANNDLENDDNQDQPDASGGKKKLVIIALVALLVLGGGAAAMMLLGGDEAAVAGAAADGEADAADAKGDPIYIPLDPAFVVNFQDKNSHTKFLKAELNVVTFDEDVEEAVTKHMPVIRNNLILLFSRQLYEDLIPHEGKETLRAEALAQVQTVIEKQMGRPGVEDLFFTSFVMQ
jgi:flagellar protein FliL